MTHEAQQQHHQSTFNRIRKSRSAKVSALLLSVALAGCGAAKATSSSHAPGRGKATPVAAASKSPSPSPSLSPSPSESSASPGSLRTVTEAQMQRLCRPDSKILNRAFQLGLLSMTVKECEVPAKPPTPGMPVLRWNISGGSLSVTVDKEPGFNGQTMKGYENTPGDTTVKVGPDTGVLRPAAGALDVGLPDGTIAELVVTGPSTTPANTDPALEEAAPLLLNLNGLNPYSSTLAG